MRGGRGWHFLLLLLVMFATASYFAYSFHDSYQNLKFIRFFYVQIENWRNLTQTHYLAGLFETCKGLDFELAAVVAVVVGWIGRIDGKRLSLGQLRASSNQRRYCRILKRQTETVKSCLRSRWLWFPNLKICVVGAVAACCSDEDRIHHHSSSDWSPCACLASCFASAACWRRETCFQLKAKGCTKRSRVSKATSKAKRVKTHTLRARRCRSKAVKAIVLNVIKAGWGWHSWSLAAVSVHLLLLLLLLLGSLIVDQLGQCFLCLFEWIKSWWKEEAERAIELCKSRPN